MLIADVVVAFLQDRTLKGRTKGTLATYHYQLRLFEIFCKENRLNQIENIKERHIERFFSEMRTRPNLKWRGDVSPVTVRKRAIALRTFFRFAKQRRFIRYDLAKRIEIPRGGRRRPKALTPVQVSQFLSVERWKPDEHLLRDYTMVVLMLDSGLRLSEVANLTLSDLDLPRGLIRVRSGKWDNDRGTVMLMETAELVRAYVGERAATRKPYNELYYRAFVFPQRRRLSFGAARSPALKRSQAKKIQYPIPILFLMCADRRTNGNGQGFQ